MTFPTLLHTRLLNIILNHFCLASPMHSVAHWHSARWAWYGYHPCLGSIPRPGWIDHLRITGMLALRLISRTGKRVWRCPL